MKLLEVCVDSLASARAAKQGGADRLEFCSALAVGGLTPYADLLRQIKAELDLPVRCLMRPRAGDFLYTRDELELLCRQIETLRSAGADGFVIGALTPEGALDLPAMRTLLDACGGAPVTLHRCIDVSRDLCATYRAAAALGIDTVLTSGGAGSCRKGISQLAALLRLRDELDGPEVLIGAGVNAAVIDELRAALPGARAFHASCKTLLESGMTFRREGVPMGLPGLLPNGFSRWYRHPYVGEIDVLRLPAAQHGDEAAQGHHAKVQAHGVHAPVVGQARWRWSARTPRRRWRPGS